MGRARSDRHVDILLEEFERGSWKMYPPSHQPLNVVSRILLDCLRKTSRLRRHG